MFGQLVQGDFALIGVSFVLLLGLYASARGYGGVRSQPIAQFSFVFSCVTCLGVLAWFLTHDAQFPRISDGSLL